MQRESWKSLNINDQSENRNKNSDWVSQTCPKHSWLGNGISLIYRCVCVCMFFFPPEAANYNIPPKFRLWLLKWLFFCILWYFSRCFLYFHFPLPMLFYSKTKRTGRMKTKLKICPFLMFQKSNFILVSSKDLKSEILGASHHFACKTESNHHILLLESVSNLYTVNFTDV